MRFSAYATFAAAVLATDAAAWRHHGQHWRWSRPMDQNGSVATAAGAVTTVTYYQTAVPTTLVRQTKTAQPDAVEVSSAPAATSTGSSSSDLSADQQAALDAHNAARKEVGVTAQVWDESLANDAQEWATHLVSVGSLTHSSGSGQGENLYMSSGDDSPFANAAKMWIDEKSSYSGQAIGEGDFSSYGHYTQIVWKSSTKVGMAVASGNGQTYVVARYSPAGNYDGETPY
ncbi:hypothetical protein AK830_g1354 [Neonectria ditissima]|uniref:SCP domain-containing protein n=1 Tax=Neonectria ditissima TaxID=78410 RepID=A0A0P7BV14_9HYPO|nr:hypothetical protein AK830_g1354 [Neonectria ditissima]